MPTADDGLEERSALLARVYSAAGQAELEQSYRDATSGEELRMRPSEWALREFDRAAATAAATAAAAAAAASTSARPSTDPGTQPAQPGHVDGAEETASGSDTESRSRRGWRGAALVASGIAVGLIAAYGAQNVVDEMTPPTMIGRTGAVSYFGAAEPPVDHAVLAVFDRAAPDVRSLPTEILAEFDASDLQRIYDPSTNGGGYDIFAARKSRDMFCLVLLKTGENYEANCGTEQQISDDGLRVTAIVPAARPVSLLADGPTPTQAPWQVEAHWNRDGTFSLSGSPVGFTG
ncbi:MULTISPECIES: hypothetical protein [unclassified Leifsonia]|uniref:hypothetical protein n=1 Tax=unclassified Leifsonia TaxID=2663824 RepID=UPI00070163E0|nr:MULTISPECIES: hypothetical protein [unclassified Leifsonia]KQX07532.1 hypothetical protein ASC59_07255 [Leifsonia sp. Root1293]KRA11814.1 hypothetical protein ASD61_07255 [Leifsonia sp. Root60]